MTCRTCSCTYTPRNIRRLKCRAFSFLFLWSLFFPFQQKVFPVPYVLVFMSRIKNQSNDRQMNFFFFTKFCMLIQLTRNDRITKVIFGYDFWKIFQLSATKFQFTAKGGILQNALQRSGQILMTDIHSIRFMQNNSRHFIVQNDNKNTFGDNSFIETVTLLCCNKALY